jgi:hypothetical protein
MPGFSKALARTLHELRLAGIDSIRLTTGTTSGSIRLTSPGQGDGGPPSPERRQRLDTSFAGSASEVGDQANADIGRLLARVEDELARAGVDDRAALFRAAAAGCRAGGVRLLATPIVLLDVPIDSRAEREFVAALVERSPDVLATVPDGDHAALAALLDLGGRLEEIREASPDGAAPVAQRGVDALPDLPVLRAYIFAKEPPPSRERSGDVRLFSAPGEGREAVEIVRRVLDEAARGVPFDEMAVCLRPRHTPARPGRPRVRRAAVVCGRRPVGQTLRRVLVARTGAGRASSIVSRPAGRSGRLVG